MVFVPRHEPFRVGSEVVSLAVGAALVAAGERKRLGKGLVFFGRDNGLSWIDETAGPGEPVPVVQRCRVVVHGSVVVAGSNRFFVRHGVRRCGWLRCAPIEPGPPRQQ